MAGKVDYNALRAATMGGGHDEEAVTVNTRALIDKVLARYSGEWTVLRELLQNAADATAKKVVVKFETLPSSSVPLPQSPSPGALLQHTILHHTIRRLVVTNDGQPFGTDDWNRLKRIAEGNPDETKIGAFGVGFYSVFSDCEEPFVSSGNEAMAFYWKSNSLFTRRRKLTAAEASGDTTFVLDYRNTTSSVPPLLPLAQFLASSITFVGLQCIELWLDDWRLLKIGKLLAPGSDLSIPKGLNTKTQESLMSVTKVHRETAQLDAQWLNVVGWKPVTPTSNTEPKANQHGLRSFFRQFATASSSSSAAAKAAREEKAAQEAIAENLLGECKTTVFLNINTATLSTHISKSFGVELERATKKSAPKTTRLAVLTASAEENEAVKEKLDSNSKLTDIFASVLPAKSGRIYIGFPTHQTTGLAAHVSAPSIIPTVERESIDLNARWVRSWNREMLRAVGIVCRISWSGEIESLRLQLSRHVKESGAVKIGEKEIAKVLPSAIHLFNKYTFSESTPSAQVSDLIEEAFWTCNNQASIEILSTRGFMPSQKVRIATGELSFVNGIPFVPKELLEQSGGFLRRLLDYGVITEVTTGDIKNELEDQAINVKQLMEFFSWLQYKLRIHELDRPTAKLLLESAVVNDDEDGKVLFLGQIKWFINPNKIPGTVPVPLNTIPFKYTRSLTKAELEGFGWEELQIVPWLRFLIENIGGLGVLPADQDLTATPEFASQMLSVISKQWDGLSQGSKETVTELLKARTTIPTKLGMRRPETAYFPSVRLFDDLPIVTVHAVKEKFLLALGVRKTIELDLVFQRLLKPDEKSSTTWSHVDLIKYLASVRNDIPRGDILKLQNTPLCLAESKDNSKVLYKISDLFEPQDELRSLGLKIVQWPGIYRPQSDEGRFLKQLGLRSSPTVKELISMIAVAQTRADVALRDKTLNYLVGFHFKNGYSVTEIAMSETPFLPLEGNDKLLSTPKRCFTNEAVTMMGFKVLRKDMHPHAAKLGVQANPPIEECVAWLIKNPPDNARLARQYFEYFNTRLSEMVGRPVEVLGKARIVPVPQKSLTNSSKEVRNKLMPPNMCLLGSGGQFSEIFEYVDFGAQANSFLISCGAKYEPTTQELAEHLVREPARIFKTLDSERRYLDLLSRIAREWNILKKNKNLVKEMKGSPFLLAYTEVPTEKATQKQNEDDDFYDEDESTIRQCQLATPGEIAIADDVINYNLFKSAILCAPQDEDLEKFYASLGAASLAGLVEERHRVGHALQDQRSAAKLAKLVQERIKLFFHDIPRDQIKRNAAWVESNLTFLAVSSISVHKKLKGRNVSYTEKTSAIPQEHPQFGKTICFTAENRDYFTISQALIHIVLHRPKFQQAIILSTLLETDLLKLRARGYDVGRILRRKAAEARIAEEARQKQLEEEQKRVREIEDSRQGQIVANMPNNHSHDPETPRQQNTMPGVFPDSPETNDLWQDLQKKPVDFFNNLTKRFGNNEPTKGTSSGQEPSHQPPAPMPTRRPGTTAAPPEQNQQNLTRNLLSAINASKSYNSRNLQSQPTMNDVNEVNTFCDSKPAQNITYSGRDAEGVKIFVAKHLAGDPNYVASRLAPMALFARVLQQVGDTMAVPRAGLHIFADEGSSTIAFNQNGSLFFNYRYFETLHLRDAQRGKLADAIVYWFVTTCHELAHNIVADHSSAHSFYTESYVAHFFGKIAERIVALIRGVPSEAPPPYA